MRVCIFKADGHLIEAQSLATEGTLIANALAMGYTADQIEEKVITDQEFIALLRTPDVVAKEALEAQKRQDILAALPDWATVAARFDQATAALSNASTLPQVKPIVQGMLDAMKLEAKVLYWLAKNTGV